MTPEERRAAAEEFRRSGQKPPGMSGFRLPTRQRAPIHVGFAAIGLLNLILAPVAVFALYLYAGGLPAGRSMGGRNSALLIGLPALPFLALSAYFWEKSGVEFRTVLEWAGVTLAVTFAVALVVLIVWIAVSW